MCADFNASPAPGNTQGGRLGFFVRTYGCQMNVRESEGISQILVNLGFVPTKEADADIIIYNTCAVRKSAEHKILGHLSRTRAQKKARPGLFVAFGGCMSQAADAAAFAVAHPYINLVFGTTNQSRLGEFILHAMECGRQVVDTELLDNPVFMPRGVRTYPHKADVIISTGCSNFCSYCIVPYARGAHKSRDMKGILGECRALASDGVREITLLGQNVNAFGTRPTDFVRLLERIGEIPGILRLRFVTSHPKDFSPELVQTLKNQPNVMNAVHLPLQSGSTRILYAMNRGYTKDDYIDLVLRLRNAVPDISITTDVIVGYPTETEEDFSDTLDVCEKSRFDGAFTFIFSPRTGTPAAGLKEVPRDVAQARFTRLIDTLHPMFLASNMRKVGRVFYVLVDEQTDGVYKGRTTCNTIVHFVSDKMWMPGDVAAVRVCEAKTFYVSGRA